MSKRIVPVLSSEIAQKLKMIGLKVKDHRKSIENNYKKFAEQHDLNYMTLWRIENGENYNMSSFIEVLNSIGISVEEFFKDAQMN